jgi:TonB-linked SusC/RagA family outer membrane protein
MLSKLTACRWWLTGVCLLFASIAVGQSTVTGKVIDQTRNQPISGATVAVKGTNVATITTEAGSFSIVVPQGRTVLVISFVGFQTQEVNIVGKTEISVTLGETSNDLNEVVVTGYSGQRRKDIVGAVSTVKGEKLAAIPSGNVEQQFQGRASGVTVITSGQPGTASQIRIRGFSSFGSNNPLYIVDGIPLFNIDFLNPNDIDNTTVLKDAASASIYGARAAAGVIVVNTKKGKSSGKATLTFDMSAGVTFPGKGLDLLNPQQQADWTWIALRNAGQIDTLTGNPTHQQYGKGVNAVLPDYLKVGGEAGLSGLSPSDPRLDPALYNTNFDKGPVYQVIRANKTGTDWYDALADPRPLQQYSLALSGGNDAARYYTSFSYYDERGPVINTSVKRITFRANSEFKVKERIRIGQNLTYVYRENPNIGGPAGENDIMFALTINNLIPVHDEGGSYAGTTAPGFNNSTNPVARRERSRQNRGFGSGVLGNFYIDVDIAKDFTFRSSFGGYYTYTQGRFINYQTYENSENVGSTTFGENAGYGGGYVWTNTVKYSHMFGAHNINALGGIEAVKDGFFRQLNGNGLNPFTNNFDFTTITTTDPAGRRVESGGFPFTQLFSQFVKADYTYNDRFLASATLRRDASSVFSKDNQYALFPAFALGWRITQEEFMSKAGWITDLKIRGGWGQMGNQRNVSPNNLINAVGGGAGTTAYDIGGSNTGTAPGLAVTGIGNPLAKWETNTTTNIGFDGTFLGTKLDVVFDWYTRTTSDLLFRQELPASLGTASAPVVNIGEIQNSGVDLMLTYRGKITNALRFETDVIFTKYKNEVTKVSDITDNFDITFTNRIGGGVVRNVVGQPLSTFYGYKVVGLFQSADDVNKSPSQVGAAPGRFKYADVNGDGAITTSDRTYIGNPNPDFTYGINVRLTYTNFDLEALFYGVSGGEVLNFTKWFTDFYPSFAGISKSTRVLNSWTPTNTNTDIPIFENVSNTSTNGELNSYYVEKGSYFRLRSIKLGYNLPANMLRSVKLEKLRFFVQATNLFTISNYTGTDPQVSGVDTNFGVDVGNYPVNKQLLFGFSLGL